MARSPLSLFPLARDLRRAGHSISFFAYSVALHSFEDNARRLLEHIRKNERGEGYGIVAHSLGGIMTRFISPELPPGLNRLVMLGPPNQAVVMAKRYGKNHLYRRATGSSGQRLGDAVFYQALPIPQVPTLIIAGRLGRRDRYSPFGDKPNDGIVTVEETQLEGAEHMVVPTFHTWIMNDPLARIVIREFLSSVGPRSGGTA